MNHVTMQLRLGDGVDPHTIIPRCHPHGSSTSTRTSLGNGSAPAIIARSRWSTGTAGRRTATGTRRRPGSTTWAFAWPHFRPASSAKHKPSNRCLERRPKGELRSRSPRAVAGGGASAAELGLERPTARSVGVPHRYCRSVRLVIMFGCLVTAGRSG